MKKFRITSTLLILLMICNMLLITPTFVQADADDVFIDDVDFDKPVDDEEDINAHERVKNDKENDMDDIIGEEEKSQDEDLNNEKENPIKENISEEEEADLAEENDSLSELGFSTEISNTNITILNEKHEVHALITEENFSDSELSDRWVTREDGGDVTVTDEGLKLERTSPSGSLYGWYYFKDDRSGSTGNIGVEFTLEKVQSGPVSMSIRSMNGPDSKFYYNGDWKANNELHVQFLLPGLSAPIWQRRTTIQSSTEAKFRAIFNTEDRSYQLWVNDQLVLPYAIAPFSGARNGVFFFDIAVPSSSNAIVLVKNIKAYEILELTDRESVERDYEWLTQESLLTNRIPGFPPTVIDSNLALPMEGRHGSTIEWLSSDPSLITENGIVTRPGSEYQGSPSVNLTAMITKGDIIEEKNFAFQILKILSDPEDFAEADYDSMHETLVTSEDTNKIRMSLNFIEEGLFGSKLRWRSKDTNTITNSGRVIRPRAGEPDKTVDVEVDIINEDIIFTKVLTFTVLADEEFVDPQYFTDEEFFGVWDEQSGTWLKEGKFNYSYNSAIKKVEDAVKEVKEGDYSIAKERLLEYMRQREPIRPLSIAGRETGWANMVVDDWHHLQRSQYFQGEFSAPNNWEVVYADVKPGQISPGGTTVYNIAAWYNEASMLEIASRNHSDVSLRPQIEVTVNGVVKTYTATDDATIRAGDYMYTNFGLEPILKVKTFGDFLGNETYRSLIKFEFPDLLDNDVVESARLVLYCRATPEFSGSKRINILYEPTTMWDEHTVDWDSIPGFVYSFNGLPGKNTWEAPRNADFEYPYQSARFLAWPAVAREYAVTQDETYAYKAIRIMEDFITDKGAENISSIEGLRGQYPRTLDANGRSGTWRDTFSTFVRSESMTPETCTAILKHLWDMAHSIMYKHASSGNWYQYEMMGLLQASFDLPEFAESIEDTNGDGRYWREYAMLALEPMIETNYFEDGSYMESTAGYNIGAFNSFMSYKEIMEENGTPVGPTYDERLINGAYYNLLLEYANGSNLQYGDQSSGRRTSPRYSQIVSWFGDRELEYIDTFGKRGVQPSWTSRMFYESRTTMMRSSWSKDALYMFTNVRGGAGGHGHMDDNHVSVQAFGQQLLIDTGIFGYTESDPLRIWGKSTRGHNTVEINNTSQRRHFGNDDPSGNNGYGTIHDWVTNSSFDFLSQTTRGTKGYEHRRTITFIKPYYWIVSDYMTPEDSARQNDYKQIWHMLPGAQFSADNENKTARSNFTSGANIILASADGDSVTVREQDGWYDRGYYEIEDAKYGWFEKEKVAGDTTFDTVLIPFQEGEGPNVETERLEIGVDTTTATALKFTVDNNGSESAAYYYLSYEENPNKERAFGKYLSNGQMAFISELDNGEYQTALMRDAAFIKDLDNGRVVVSYPDKVNDISVEWKGRRLVVTTTDENIEYKNLKIASNEHINSFVINGVESEFVIEDGYIVTDGSKRSTPLPGDNNSSVGIVGGGGSGGSGGGSVVPGDDPNLDSDKDKDEDLPIDGVHFKDTDDIEWAKEEIEFLHEKGIVKGQEEGIFNPHGNVSRAEFITFIIRALELETLDFTGEFNDVKEEDWYSANIETALKNGLITKDDNFRPDAFITREEMTKIIVEAYKTEKEMELPQDFSSNFEDEAEISDWAQEYIDAANYLGLVRGMGDKFAPKENTTRAQAAVIIKRLIDSL